MSTGRNSGEEGGPDNFNVVEDFVAGWLSGVTGLLAGHPFDTIKARLQTDGLDGPRVYRGTIHCIKHMAAKEGVRSFYKGMMSPMLGMAAINAITFGVQGNMMKSRTDTVLNHAYTGAVGGAAQCFICAPMELIKLRLQIQTNPTEIFHWPTHPHATNNGRVYSDPWNAFKKIYNQGGIRGLYKGLELTLMREIPAFAVYFGSYEFICREIIRMRGNGMTFDDLSPWLLCLAGGVSGINAWVVTYPVDVVKSRMQVDGMFGVKHYSSFMDCFWKSLREPEGHWVLWKGLNSTLVRGFVVNAATFPTYSLFLRYWRYWRQQS